MISRSWLAWPMVLGVLAGVPASPGQAQPSPGSLVPCPDTGLSFEGGCACWAPRIAPVWGTDLYAGQSAICAAAVHAGIVTMNGGTVLVRRAPGQSHYGGSTRNGVTSQTLGAAESSFRLEQHTGGYGSAPRR